MLDKFKGILKSTTIWFNTVGITILGVALTEPTLLTYLNEHGFNAILIVGNILLRFKTTKSLAAK